MLVGATTSHLERDCAERTKDDVVTLLRRMLTAEGVQADEDIVNQVLLKVRGATVDGGVAEDGTSNAVDRVSEHRYHHAGSCTHHQDLVP